MGFIECRNMNYTCEKLIRRRRRKKNREKLNIQSQHDRRLVIRFLFRKILRISIVKFNRQFIFILQTRNNHRSDEGKKT